MPQVGMSQRGMLRCKQLPEAQLRADFACHTARRESRGGTPSPPTTLHTRQSTKGTSSPAPPHPLLTCGVRMPGPTPARPTMPARAAANSSQRGQCSRRPTPKPHTAASSASCMGTCRRSHRWEHRAKGRRGQSPGARCAMGGCNMASSRPARPNATTKRWAAWRGVEGRAVAVGGRDERVVCSRFECSMGKGAWQGTA